MLPEMKYRHFRHSQQKDCSSHHLVSSLLISQIIKALQKHHQFDCFGIRGYDVDWQLFDSHSIWTILLPNFWGRSVSPKSTIPVSQGDLCKYREGRQECPTLCRGTRFSCTWGLNFSRFGAGVLTPIIPSP